MGAVVVGMTLFTNKRHICRAALESVAFQSVDVVEAMRQDTGLSLKSMRTHGGMTSNNLLMQIQADLLGIEVLRPKMLEATAMGAAFAAGLAVDFWATADDMYVIAEKA